ncbi:MAG: hypothetical protein LH478_00225 [Chitinophagaceae bacterium]|nr:hypothetical protein [Chitinophagaceae bacterium]
MAGTIFYLYNQSNAMPEKYLSMNEVKMLEFFRQEDENAFTAFYNYYSPALLGVILLITRNKDAAYDALTKTFKEIWLTKKDFKNTRRLFLWMLKIARRRAFEARFVT